MSTTVQHLHTAQSGTTTMQPGHLVSIDAEWMLVIEERLLVVVKKWSMIVDVYSLDVLQATNVLIRQV